MPTAAVHLTRIRRACPSILVVALFSGLACAPLLPSRIGRAAAARRAEVVQAADPLAGPWIVRDGGLRRSQLVTVRALLTSETGADVRVDTLHSTLLVAWSGVPGSWPTRLAGMVTDFRVAVGGDHAIVPAGVSIPFSFVAVSQTDGSQPAFTIPDGSSCSNPNASAVHGVRDTWLSLPDTLARGTTWRDSSTYVVCRDGIPLTVSAERTFTATGARLREGQLVVIVQRSTQMRLAGSGLQLGERLEIVGEGEGTMLLDVALAGGVILQAEGMAELRLEMQGRRRTQRLLQASTVTIREP